MSEHPTPDSVQSNSIAFAAAPSISRLLGVMPILPGETADLYQASLDTLIEELGARSLVLCSSSPCFPLPTAIIFAFAQHSALSFSVENDLIT